MKLSKSTIIKNIVLVITLCSATVTSEAFHAFAAVGAEPIMYIPLKGAVAAFDSPLSGEGTLANPYIIADAMNLKTLAHNVNYNGESYNGKYIKQTADIDLSGFDTGDGLGWMPIASGDDSLGDNGLCFKGAYDGGGYTIENMTIERGGSDYIGLFGRLGENGLIKNVNLVNCDISGDYHVGGIVGYSYIGTVENCGVSGNICGKDGGAGGVIGYKNGGSITNCHMSGKVSGNLYTGGITGHNAGSLASCVNDATVESGTNTYAVGGIVGRNSYIVSDCRNNGSVSGEAGRAGGIAGYSSDEVRNCDNNGSVTGTAVGGIVGVNSGLWIRDCVNRGEIFGKTYTGGILGNSTEFIQIYDCVNQGNVNSGGTHVGGILGRAGVNASIYYCTNSGSVKNETANNSYIGGIIGSIINVGHISGCANTGAVSGIGLMVGGIAGQNRCKITSCYNTGAVTSQMIAGGIVGLNEKSGTIATAISQCFNSGAVTGGTNTGGIVGEAKFIAGAESNDYDLIQNCYNTGDLSSFENTGGIVGSVADPFAQVTSCYSTGGIVESGNTGGIVGSLSAGSFASCYYNIDKFSGNIFGTNATGTITALALTTEQMTANNVLLTGGISGMIGLASNTWVKHDNIPEAILYYPELRAFYSGTAHQQGASRISVMVSIAGGTTMRFENNILTIVTDPIDAQLYAVQYEYGKLKKVKVYPISTSTVLGFDTDEDFVEGEIKFMLWDGNRTPITEAVPGVIIE